MREFSDVRTKFRWRESQYVRICDELPEMPLFFHPVAFATNSKTLFIVELVSWRPRDMSSQFACTVDNAE